MPFHLPRPIRTPITALALAIGLLGGCSWQFEVDTPIVHLSAPTEIHSGQPFALKTWSYAQLGWTVGIREQVLYDRPGNKVNVAIKAIAEDSISVMKPPRVWQVSARELQVTLPTAGSYHISASTPYDLGHASQMHRDNVLLHLAEVTASPSAELTITVLP